MSRAIGSSLMLALQYESKRLLYQSVTGQQEGRARSFCMDDRLAAVEGAIELKRCICQKKIMHLSPEPVDRDFSLRQRAVDDMYATKREALLGHVRASTESLDVNETAITIVREDFCAKWGGMRTFIMTTHSVTHPPELVRRALDAKREILQHSDNAVAPLTGSAVTVDRDIMVMYDEKMEVLTHRCHVKSVLHDVSSTVGATAPIISAMDSKWMALRAGITVQQSPTPVAPSSMSSIADAMQMKRDTCQRSADVGCKSHLSATQSATAVSVSEEYDRKRLVLSGQQKRQLIVEDVRASSVSEEINAKRDIFCHRDIGTGQIPSQSTKGVNADEVDVTIALQHKRDLLSMNSKTGTIGRDEPYVANSQLGLGIMSAIDAKRSLLRSSSAINERLAMSQEEHEMNQLISQLEKEKSAVAIGSATDSGSKSSPNYGGVSNDLDVKRRQLKAI